MKKHSPQMILILLALTLCACVGALEEIPEIPQPVVWLNKPADFRLPSFKGKITVIGFYTEDCEDTVMIDPVLQRIQQQYGPSVQILGVYTPLPHQKLSQDEVKLLLKKNKISYPIILDEKTEILRKFRVTRWPTLFVANANGQIVSRIEGSKSILARTERAVHQANLSDK